MTRYRIMAGPKHTHLARSDRQTTLCGLGFVPMALTNVTSKVNRKLSAVSCGQCRQRLRKERQ